MPARPAPSTTYRSIYAVIARIPRGKVATYGQVAEMAGLPRQARLVGYALNVLPAGSDLPWFRVINAKGQVSARSVELGHEQMQAQILAREGIEFEGETIPLARYRWQPRVVLKPKRAVRKKPGPQKRGPGKRRT